MLAKEYQSALDWLFKQFPSYQVIGSKAYKPTLENINRICQLIGNPQKDLKFVHIAGTNGKGSCSSMLASILTESGLKTGLFTSPHLIDFRERIRINGEMIRKDKVLSFVEKVRSFDLSFEPSFFEISFAMALEYFIQEDCDICVIETGLGGRLDATNIIQPMCCLITNISLEHTAILGDTIEEIAYEKAGIIKNGIPVVIGESTDRTQFVFKEQARLRNAPIYFADEIISDDLIDQFQLPLLGDYQKKNFRSVLSILNVLQPTYGPLNKSVIQRGLDHLNKNSGFRGRLQIIGRDPLVILDVSHNEAGIRETLKTIQQLNRGKLHLLYGSSADKDINAIVSLFPSDAAVHLTTFNNQRSMSLEMIENLRKEIIPTAKIHANALVALEQIKSNAQREDTILVFGSFFLISDLLN